MPQETKTTEHVEKDVGIENNVKVIFDNIDAIVSHNKERNEELVRLSRELERTKEQLAIYEKNNTIPIGNLTKVFLMYVAKCHTNMKKEGLSDEVYFEKLIDDLDNLGIKLLYHEPDSKIELSDNNLKVQQKMTKDKEKNLVVLKCDSFGCTFDNGIRAIEEELTVYVYDKKITITLDYGNKTEEHSIIEGQKYHLPTPVSDDGSMVITGWIDVDGKYVGEDISVYEDIILRANYEFVKNDFEITFDEGHVRIYDADKIVKSGDKIEQEKELVVKLHEGYEIIDNEHYDSEKNTFLMPCEDCEIKTRPIPCVCKYYIDEKSEVLIEEICEWGEKIPARIIPYEDDLYIIEYEFNGIIISNKETKVFASSSIKKSREYQLDFDDKILSVVIENKKIVPKTTVPVGTVIDIKVMDNRFVLSEDIGNQHTMPPCDFFITTKRAMVPVVLSSKNPNFAIFDQKDLSADYLSLIKHNDSEIILSTNGEEKKYSFSKKCDDPKDVITIKSVSPDSITRADTNCNCCTITVEFNRKSATYEWEIICGGKPYHVTFTPNNPKLTIPVVIKVEKKGKLSYRLLGNTFENDDNLIHKSFSIDNLKNMKYNMKLNANYDEKIDLRNDSDIEKAIITSIRLGNHDRGDIISTISDVDLDTDVVDTVLEKSEKIQKKGKEYFYKPNKGKKT